MGKQKEKYMVLREVSQDWIKACGAERKLRQVGKLYVIALLIILTGTMVAFNVDVGIPYNMIASTVFSLVFCIYVVAVITLWRAGKNYFKEIKDKEQPILLEKMPSWWRNK